ncbi:amino acid ABC transporter permease [Oenococcus sicerae]|uniref:Amino acid ABC transporter permease n=1 Tax=Oenococcus sicerae TaxID=2203724 RepID=A0AAJ1RB27_9LACO|nr:amino acid ABC transporter permease [Oenococcus sicerae]MDN6900515.1 amino acid ABC transporter permease [Oenococcus sicerae]QAS69465.1 amino acid ABC transporter permease [Oenococcus sicerae]VDK13354.1 putative glutamine ABC transporter permease protein GlnM [Oenococcus sicerae]
MINLLTSNFSVFVTAFGYTLVSSLIALVVSTILGTVFAILQIVPSKTARVIAKVYVEIFRNIPLLIIVMFFYLVGTRIVKIDGFTAGTIGLSLYTSAFIAETVRAGINSVGIGQTEGARSNGLSFWQTLRIIVLPQAFKIAIPSLGNQFINLVKNSSILAFVAGGDLMYTANNVAAATFDSFNSYIIVGIFYLIITLPLSYYMKYLEARLKRIA